jgi:two-component system OmpR family sensor kinase
MRGSLRSSVIRTVVVAAGVGGGLAVFTAFAVYGHGANLVLFAGLGLVSAVLAALVAWPIGAALARRTTTPLERLAAAASSFGAGDLSVRATDDGPREVRQIARSFNRMADDVQRALSELRAEERRKSQFVSDVSHELRTPLTAIRGAAETLLDGDVPSDDQQRFLSTIAIESGRLARLADDLLTLQRIEGATGELPLRRVDLRQAVDRAAAMLQPLLEDRDVTLVVDGQAPLVLGDVDRLQQVVANLLDNASRIVGEGGRVDVVLGEDDGQSLLTVADNGPGIPEEDIPRLFDRFYRPQRSRDRSSGGAGLGLAIVRAIVTAHGGSIEAANRVEGGFRFTVRLPSLPRDEE